MGPLEVVRLSAIQLRDSQEYYEYAIRGAYYAGHSLREIAKVAEISHEQVRRIVVKKGNN